MDLDIRLQPKQEQLRELVDSPEAGWIGYGGSRGGSKSHGGRIIMLLRRLEWPGTRGLIIRRKKKELLENHIEPLFRQFPVLRRWYNQQTNTLNLPNKSAIVFGYAEHPAHDRVGDIYDFQGSEWADILVDEATYFNQDELEFLKTCNRWTGGSFMPKLILTANPGGRGHEFLKRVMLDRKFLANELPSDYAFLRAFAWDNIEWVRDALRQDGIQAQAATYYDEWTDDQRLEYFLTRSDYGRVLNGLQGKRRQAYLFGDWEAFAGQYFDNFVDVIGGPHVALSSEIKLEPWWPKWISIDWGYDHPSAVYWHCQAETRTITYAEFVQDRLSPGMLAQAILERTKDSKLAAVYLSPDAYAQRTSEDTIARQLDKVFAGRLPPCSKADDDRVGGWMLLYQLLESELWTISSECEKLIANLPTLVRDDNNREDILKVPGDDPADSVRYGLKSRLSPRQAPPEKRVEQRIAAIAQRDGQAMSPTSEMIWRSRYMREEQRKTLPVKFGVRRSIRSLRPSL